MKRRLYTFLILFFMVGLTVKAQTDTIKIYYMGSSSFSDELAQTTCNIMEASGDYYVEKTRGGGYFRLDYMQSDSMQYVNWVNTYMPQIIAGQYDYVVMQTLGWGAGSPETVDWFMDWMLVDMMQRIRAAGAEPVFYQKYGATYGCYPDPIYYNDLLHLRAGVTCNMEKITFAARSMFELRDIPYFVSMGFLMDGTGHPGEMANYVTACVLSYLMTGVDPRGNTVRSLPLQGWAYDTWDALPDTDPKKSRVVDGNLILTEWEADTLQRIAMHSYLPWGERLAENLADENVYSDTRDEMLLFELDYGNIYDRGYAQNDIDRLETVCDQSYTNVLTSEEIDSIRDISKLFSQRIQDAADLYLTTDEVNQLQKDYDDYWFRNNVKLRDDVYFYSLINLAIAKYDGDVGEIARLTAENEMLLEVLSQAAENMLLEKMSETDRNTYLSTYTWDTPLSDYTPMFGQLQLDSAGSPNQLMFIREMYFKVWEDPNLMDELKTSNYSQNIWLKSDTLFMEDWNDLLALNSSGTYLLIVSGGTGSGEYSQGTSIIISAKEPALGNIFDAWYGSVNIADVNASTTTFTMPEANVRLSAIYSSAGAEVPVLNFSFETPDIASYQYSPSGASWTWNPRAGSVGSGITDNNGTAWTGMPIELFAPDGDQAGYIQTTGWISQDIDFPDGTYAITFKAAQRPVWQDSYQVIDVLVGSQVVGTFNPSTNDEYLEYTTNTFTANGVTELRFEGTNPNGGDNTVLIDDIKIFASVPDDSEAPSTPSSLSSSNITYHSFTLTWTASTDNLGVAKYEIFKDGVKTGESFTNSYEISGLSGSTTYAVKVRAVDAAGNASVFSSALDVTTSVAPITYALTVNSGTGDGNYEEADIVTIIANAPAIGKAFAAWIGDVTNVDDVNATTTTIIMPAAATNVTATYVDLTYTITFSVTDGTEPIQNAPVTFNSQTVNTDVSGQAVFYDVVYGTGLAYTITKTGYQEATGTVDATSNLTENVPMSEIPPTLYTLSVISGSGDGDYEEGEEVNITAGNPAAGKEFLAWTGDVANVANVANVNLATTTITMPASDVTITATYLDLTYTVTFNVSDGTNSVQDAVVTFNSTTVNTDANGQAVFSDVVYGSGLTYTVSKTGYSTANSTVDVTADVTKNVTISMATTYSVSITNGTGSGNYEEGATVNITANAAPTDQEFDQWTGDVSVLADATVAATSFTMPASAVTLTATYKNIVAPTYAVTITNGIGSGDYEEGETVIIEADAASTGQEFDKWIGDTLLLPSVTATATSFVMPDSAVELIATYKDLPNAVSDYENMTLLFPNPTSNMITISSKIMIEKIQIFNITGKLVDETNTNTLSCSLDLSDMNNGVYFVNIIHHQRFTETMKLVKY